MFTTKSFCALLSLSAAVLALPIQRREVPQEHSHEQFITSVRASLNLDNPDSIGDPIFALLGNAAAAQGLGGLDIDVECLQQAVADQAFTNAKAAGDVDAQVSALIYRALERNSGAVGQVSDLCTTLTAVNPEIAALQQHQDPASDGAADLNKSIVLELAKQIASVGGDPLDALKSGTFAPGDLGDNTGAGNTCDDLDDPVGCIFTQDLLVPDATEEEVIAAAEGVAVGGADDGADAGDAADNGAADDAATCAAAVTVTVTATATEAAQNTAVCDTPVTVTVTVDDAATETAAATGTAAETTAAAESTAAASGAASSAASASASASAVSVSASASAASASSTASASAASASATASAVDTAATATETAAIFAANQQTFTGALGDIAAPAVTEGGRGLQVAGNASFLTAGAALGRSCDVQHNQCANAANAGADFSVEDCDAQLTECRALI